jgi:acetyltransferase
VSDAPNDVATNHGYPSRYVTTHTLPGGERVLVRPIRPSDDVKLLDLYERLSAESLYARFLAFVTPLPRFLEYLTHVDYDNHFALVAEIDGAVVGVSRFVRNAERPDIAEPAVVVADAEQGHHIGATLLDALGHVALDLGIGSFEFDVLAENRRVLTLVDKLGFPTTRRNDGATVHVVVTLPR